VELIEVENAIIKDEGEKKEKLDMRSLDLRDIFGSISHI
jgi:hypothetical protein